MKKLIIILAVFFAFNANGHSQSTDAETAKNVITKFTKVIEAADSVTALYATYLSADVQISKTVKAFTAAKIGHQSSSVLAANNYTLSKKDTLLESYHKRFDESRLKALSIRSKVFKPSLLPKYRTTPLSEVVVNEDPRLIADLVNQCFQIKMLLRDQYIPQLKKINQ